MVGVYAWEEEDPPGEWIVHIVSTAEEAVRMAKEEAESGYHSRAVELIPYEVDAHSFKLYLMESIKDNISSDAYSNEDCILENEDDVMEALEKAIDTIEASGAYKLKRVIWEAGNEQV